MKNLNLRLFIIVVVIALALWIDFSQEITIRSPLDGTVLFYRNVEPRLGLDLRGGLQVLLEADLPAEAKIDADQMDVARTILENRTNALGVSESIMQVAPPRRIVGEFPGVNNPDEIMKTLGQTGLLEFVEMGDNPLPDGTVIVTDFGQESAQQPAATPTAEATPTAAPTAEATALPAGAPAVYHTVMTGAVLDEVAVTTDQLAGYQISFTLKSEGKQIFADYTSTHVGQFLAIVLDKKVISAPRIQTAITEGSGVITGKFSVEEANSLAIQLRYGSLPIPFKLVESRIVGPTLGQDSLNKSLIAGLVGMIVVILFMAIYYRLPGLLADIAILIYALTAFAVFKYIPVTLTLAGVAGFLLSTGAALDANILIFERMKEELRSGRGLRQAIDLGWTRAWPSIRDSNVATLITCGILFWFGSTFGATIVKGFSLTLALGVAISLFTAIVVTRTLLNLVLTFIKPGSENLKWFGI